MNFLTGAALVATIWISLFVTRIGRDMITGDRPNRAIITETFTLSCLSPQQAGDIINPYLRSRGSTYYVSTSGLSAITVHGTPDELRAVAGWVRESMPEGEDWSGNWKREALGGDSCEYRFALGGRRCIAG